MSKNNKNGLFDPYSVEIEESKEISELLNYSDILAQVAKALIDYRNKNSLTQKQLADKLNMSQSMVSKLEKGDYNATLRLLLKISYILNDDSQLFIEILQNIINNLESKEQYKIININKCETQLYGNMYSYTAKKTMVSYDMPEYKYVIGE